MHYEVVTHWELTACFLVNNYNTIVVSLNIENLKSIIPDCDGLSIRTAKLPSEVIELGKKLKVISRHGVGYDNIDLKSSKKNNITIAITDKHNAFA